jgi:hypothetical protein
MCCFCLRVQVLDPDKRRGQEVLRPLPHTSGSLLEHCPGTVASELDGRKHNIVVITRLCPGRPSRRPRSDIRAPATRAQADRLKLLRLANGEPLLCNGFPATLSWARQAPMVRRGSRLSARSHDTPDRCVARNSQQLNNAKL